MAEDSGANGGTAVLVVEDESMIRMMLVDELEEAGLTVIEADGADAAIAKLETDLSIALVVTDIRMPGSMDGLGLARWMHTNTPDCPIIITSGFASPPDFAAINPAISCVWSKPYVPTDVVACVIDMIVRMTNSTSTARASATL